MTTDHDDFTVAMMPSTNNTMPSSASSSDNRVLSGSEVCLNSNTRTTCGVSVEDCGFCRELIVND